MNNKLLKIHTLNKRPLKRFEMKKITLEEAHIPENYDINGIEMIFLSIIYFLSKWLYAS